MGTVKRIKCGNVNSYVVSEGDSAILVDTGRKKYLDIVIEACKPYKMKLIVLTHGHNDHAENAAELSEKFGIPVAMNKDDVNLIESGNNQPLSARNFIGELYCPLLLRNSRKET